MTKKLLGLDVGDKRIGLAVSDDLGLMAHALSTLNRTNFQKDISELQNIVEEYGVEEIIVGLPVNMSGEYGPRAKITLEFIEKIKRFFDIPIVPWDERLSTQAAQRPLMEAGLNWRKRRKVVDQVAAAIILQNYLDYKKFNP